jgi:hypothetical protein
MRRVDFNYTFLFNSPDGTIQKITGTFNGTTYPYEFYVEPEWVIITHTKY